ncbi:hypothetical protein ACFO9Q_00510 [Paenibacillus sp. GCM10023252]|uniref:hypothetical protein n=1 Tax=Paenibacillus sp. GCM10023252 TaxID=3252649 RepID=UPI00361D76FC
MMNEVLNRVNAKLEELREASQQERELHRRQKLLNTSIGAERRRVTELEVQLDLEQEDVEKLMKLSWTSLFHSILRSKEEQLELERQQVLAVSLKLQEAREELAKLEGECRSVGAGLSEVSGSERAYVNVLREKEKLIRESGSDAAFKLGQLDTLMTNELGHYKELREASGACNQLVSALERASDWLDSAENWGTWDMLGGGTMTTAIKHSKINEAREAIHEARHTLSRLQAELADLERATTLEVPIGELAVFADYFFDGLITDWIVQGRIKESQENVLAQLRLARPLQEQLRLEVAESESKQAAYRREHDAIIETLV